MGSTSPLIAVFALIGSAALTLLVMRLFAELILSLPGVTR